jgi:hypothetical protein
MFIPIIIDAKSLAEHPVSLELALEVCLCMYADQVLQRVLKPPRPTKLLYRAKMVKVYGQMYFLSCA